MGFATPGGPSPETGVSLGLAIEPALPLGTRDAMVVIPGLEGFKSRRPTHSLPIGLRRIHIEVQSAREDCNLT